MMHKLLKSGRCPICGKKARKVGQIYICDNCKIVFNEYGVSKMAKRLMDEFGASYEFDIFGHPNEETIKENLN